MMKERIYQRIKPRDVALILARQRQEIIGDDLSRLVGDDYLEDIMEHIQTMEA
jgi:hypothetical protein